jgi:hypothetical protein
VTDVGEEETLLDGDVGGILVIGGVNGALVRVSLPTNMGIVGLRGGYASVKQNFNPIIPRTIAVIGHGITTRRAEQRKTSRCRRTCRAVSCSRRRPSRPRTVRPSAPDTAPPRYPHVQGGSAAYRTARFATAAWRGREVSGGCSFADRKLG